MLIAGPGGVAMRTDCVDLCNEIIVIAPARQSIPPRAPDRGASAAPLRPAQAAGCFDSNRKSPLAPIELLLCSERAGSPMPSPDTLLTSRSVHAQRKEYLLR